MSLVTDYSTSSLNHSCAKLPSCVNRQEKWDSWLGKVAMQKLSVQVNMYGLGHTISKHGVGQKEHLFPGPSELKARAEVKNKCLSLIHQTLQPDLPHTVDGSLSG